MITGCDVIAVPSADTVRSRSFHGGIAFTDMAFFTDPDGSDLTLHHRYAPFE